MFLNTFASLFGSIFDGQAISNFYINFIKWLIGPFIQPHWAGWFCLSAGLILMICVTRKLGVQFLNGMKNLPLRLSFQKRFFAFISLLLQISWIFIFITFSLAAGLGYLYFQSGSFLFQLSILFLPVWILGTLLGWIVGKLAARYIAATYEPKCSKNIDEDKVQNKDSMSDIRDVYKMMANTIDFDPEAYFKPGEFFVGHDEEKKPIYITLKQFLSTHIQIMGCTGSGKGVVAVCLLAQALQQGIAVFVFEPKQGGDEWAPHVLKKMAEVAGKKFHLIDLQADKPQINLLDGISPDELDQLLQAGMGIEDKGSDGDYYRLKDRKAARIGSHLASRASCFPHFEHLMREELPELMEAADSFSDKLEMISQIKAVQTTTGLDLRKAIEEGDCVYIIGSPDRAQIKLLQRMVLLRVKQLVERRDRLQQHRHVTILVDEVKYFLTRPLLDSLAMIRDHQCNLILAHQSPGDLYDVPKDLDGRACYTCVVSNTNIKLIYKLNEADDQRKASSLTGTKTVQRISKEVLTNVGMGSIVETDRQHVMATPENLYSENIFTALPPRVGVLVGVGIAQLCFTSPIKVEKSKLKIMQFEASPAYKNNTDDVSEMESNAPKKTISAHKESEEIKPQSCQKQRNEDEIIQFFDEELHHNIDDIYTEMEDK